MGEVNVAGKGREKTQESNSCVFCQLFGFFRL